VHVLDHGRMIMHGRVIEGAEGLQRLVDASIAGRPDFGRQARLDGGLPGSVDAAVLGRFMPRVLVGGGLRVFVLSHSLSSACGSR
jgi:hypothetical protein